MRIKERGTDREKERERKRCLFTYPPSEKEFPDELGQVESFPKSDKHLNHIFPLHAIPGFV